MPALTRDTRPISKSDANGHNDKPNSTTKKTRQVKQQTQNLHIIREDCLLKGAVQTKGDGMSKGSRLGEMKKLEEEVKEGLTGSVKISNKEVS